LEGGVGDRRRTSRWSKGLAPAAATSVASRHKEAREDTAGEEMANDAWIRSPPGETRVRRPPPRRLPQRPACQATPRAGSSC
jgi:hypothetical protein